MKNSKVVLASLLLIGGVVTFSSFASKYYNKKAFDLVCFYYVGVQPAITTDIENPSQWSDAGSTAPDCTVFNKLCAICLDDTQLDDDGKPDTTTLRLVDDNWQIFTTQGREIIITIGTPPYYAHTGIFVFRKP